MVFRKIVHRKDTYFEVFPGTSDSNFQPKMASMWLMFYILMATDICGRSQANVTDAKQVDDLCAYVSVEKPFNILGASINNDGMASYNQCIATMNGITQWQEFSVVKQIIQSYKLKSVAQLTEAVDIFKSHSLNSSSSIAHINRYLVDKKKNSLADLREILDASRNTFNIYREWITTNQNKNCDEERVMVISQYASTRTKELDKSALFKIFEIICYDVVKEEEKGWRTNQLEFIFNSDYMKNVDLQEIEFVLHYCRPFATKMMMNYWNEEYSPERVMESLKKLETDEERAWMVRAVCGAYEIKLKISTIEDMMKQPEMERFGKIQVLRFIAELEYSFLRIKDNRDENYFRKLAFNALRLESKYTQFKKTPMDIHQYIRQCTASFLSIRFINNFLEDATGKGLSMYLFVPFLQAACPSLREPSDEEKILEVLQLFTDLNLFNQSALSNITNKNDHDPGTLIQVYDLVSIRKEIGDRSNVGIRAYFQNFNICYCPKSVLSSLLKYAAAKQCQSESFYKSVYNIVCKETNHEKEIIEAIESNSKASPNDMETNLNSLIHRLNRE